MRGEGLSEHRWKRTEGHHTLAERPNYEFAITCQNFRECLFVKLVLVMLAARRAKSRYAANAWFLVCRLRRVLSGSCPQLYGGHQEEAYGYRGSAEKRVQSLWCIGLVEGV